jgi:hypothetical protein
MNQVHNAIAALFSWIANHQAVLIPLALLVVNDLKNALSTYPKAETVLGILSDLLSWHQNSDSPGTLKLPFTRSTNPRKPDKPSTAVVGNGGAVAGVKLEKPSAEIATPNPSHKAVRVLITLASVFIAETASAQVLSTGATLPMLEFQSDNTHPVQFAPGAGAMLSLGLLQTGLGGQQWDLLDFSVSLFGTALATPTGAPAGQLQFGLEVGTLNNIIAVGAATPLYGPDGIGVFQGSFKVYPLLTLNLPVSLAPYSPPVGIAEGPAGLPRGGTLYLLAPKPAEPGSPR